MNRERAKGQYGVSPYFLSKLVAELPISALFPLGFGCLLYPMAGLHKGFNRWVADFENGFQAPFYRLEHGRSS